MPPSPPRTRRCSPASPRRWPSSAETSRGGGRRWSSAGPGTRAGESDTPVHGPRRHSAAREPVQGGLCQAPGGDPTRAARQPPRTRSRGGVRVQTRLCPVRAPGGRAPPARAPLLAPRQPPLAHPVKASRAREDPPPICRLQRVIAGAHLPGALSYRPWPPTNPPEGQHLGSG